MNQRRSSRKWIWRGIALLVPMLLFLFRIQILSAIGRWLNTPDKYTHTQYLFVLSGSPFDRGAEASRLINLGYADSLRCTGAGIAYPANETHPDITEGQVALDVVRQSISDSACADTFFHGTSTHEELLAILAFAQKQSQDTVAVLSSDYHLRRIRMFYADDFEDAGVTLLLYGSGSQFYVLEEWWKTEQGSVFITNEYIKMVYYMFNH